MSGKGKKEVLRISNEKDVKFVHLWFADILGFLKSFPIAVRKSKEAVADVGLKNPESRI